MSLFHDILNELRALSEDGGWVFRALIVLAFGISFALLSLWRSMRYPHAPLLSPGEWTKLLDSPDPSPPLVDSLRARLQAGGEIPSRLHEVAQKMFALPQRRFPFAFVLIGAAPLIRLLGTVSGMFKTFRGMATNSSTAPIDVISKGISEALITTQTGLVIAVPTFIVCSWMKSRFDQQLLAFGRIESRLLQQTPTT